MNDKIELVLSELRKGFPGQVITYQFDLSVHKFRFENSGFTHWLYISSEFIEDNEKVLILNILTGIYHIVDAFKEAKSSKRLLLTNDGVEEVKEGFIK